MNEPLIKDWKHNWLTCGGGWEAFAIWCEARWDPLEPEDRLAFVLRVTGGKTEHSLLLDEFGELVDDSLLSVDAYANDPEVPSHMLTPYVHIEGESLFENRR